MNIFNILFVLLSFIPIALFHEYIHLIVLRKKGWDGKLVLYKKKKMLIGFGIKPTIYKDNFICANDIQSVCFAPMFFLWTWCIPFLMFDFSLSSILIGLLIGFSGGLGDVYHIVKLERWWVRHYRHMGVLSH